MIPREEIILKKKLHVMDKIIAKHVKAIVEAHKMKDSLQREYDERNNKRRD